MRVFFGFEDLPKFIKPVVTIGSYDGVHKGHRALLDQVVELSKESGGESVVITFFPHPREVLRTNQRVDLLTTLDEKIELFREAEIDYLIVAPFTAEFSKLSTLDFIRDYLVQKVGVDRLLVGYDNHFGHNQEGNYDYLERLKEKFGFNISVFPRQEVGEDGVSSTIIRDLIKRGELRAVSEYLGYRYFIFADIESFEKRSDGKMIIDLQELPLSKLLPPAGEYEVRVAKVGEQDNETNAVLKISSNRSLSLIMESEIGESDKIVITFC